MDSPSLRGTRWRLQALQDSSGPTLVKPPGPAPELLLAVDQERVSSTGGCNRLMGGFRLAGEEFSFSRLASTKMACLPEVMAFERRYSEALLGCIDTSRGSTSSVAIKKGTAAGCFRSLVSWYL